MQVLRAASSGRGGGAGGRGSGFASASLSDAASPGPGGSVLGARGVPAAGEGAPTLPPRLRRGGGCGPLALHTLRAAQPGLCGFRGAPAAGRWPGSSLLGRGGFLSAATSGGCSYFSPFSPLGRVQP